MVKELCVISGTVGLSLGVSQRGRTVYHANYGYREIDEKLAPDSDTVYPVSSLTKFITCAALGSLVHKGRLRCDSLLSQVLPGYRRKELDGTATLRIY